MRHSLIHTLQQRLGSISLKQDDEQAIELFEWTGITASAVDALETQVASLSARYRTAEETISKLNKQLEELVRAKSEHEDQLIAKCVQLLNEKKLKIRNQQRLLASANADPEKGWCLLKYIYTIVDNYLTRFTTSVHELEAAVSSGTRKRQAGASRVSKRKAPTPVGTDSEDGFEKMEVDEKRGQPVPEDEEETDSDRPETPQPLEEEEETASDQEMEDNEAIPPPTGKESIVPEVNAVGAIQGNAGPPALRSRNSPPPRRELPFKRTKGRDERRGTPEKPAAPPSPGDGGETDDDEL